VFASFNAAAIGYDVGAWAALGRPPPRGSRAWTCGSATWSTPGTTPSRCGRGWTTSASGAAPGRCRSTGGGPTARTARPGPAAALAEAAATLGLTRTGTWVLPETPACAPNGRRAARRIVPKWSQRHHDRLGAIGRILADNGIRLGLEVIGVAASRTAAASPSSTAWPTSRRSSAPAGTTCPTRGSSSTPSTSMRRERTWTRGWPGGSIASSGSTSPTCRPRPIPTGRDPGRPARAARRERGGRRSGILLGLAERGYTGPVTVETRARRRSPDAGELEAAARTVATALRAVWPRPVVGRL
jgi:hypothetical protein